MVREDRRLIVAVGAIGRDRGFTRRGCAKRSPRRVFTEPSDDELIEIGFVSTVKRANPHTEE